MNIFIDTISTNSKIILFDNNRQIIDILEWLSKGKESTTLLPNIDSIIKRNGLEYGSLENIVLVNGPGSFTGVRTTCLVVNTLNYVIKKNITTLNYFQLFKNYPIVKSSSKRDCFLKRDRAYDIEIISNDDLETYLKNNCIKKVYGEGNFLTPPSPLNRGGIKNNSPLDEGDLELLDNIDYSAIIGEIKLDKEKRINPLYIKKPNIS